MALTTTTADAVLKEDYQPEIRKQLNDAFMILAQIESNSRDVEGRRAVLSLHIKRNSGVGARAEGGTLPTAGNQGYQEERVTLKYNYGRMQVNGPVIKAMKSDRGSFTRAIESESKGLLTDMKRDVNRQCYNNAEGTIAQCGTTSASTTVQLASTTSTVQMRQLEVGMKVDIGTLAAPNGIASEREITSYDRTNLTITISGAAVTTSSSHYVTRSGSKSTSGSTSELTGLQAIVTNSGTLFNVNPSTVLLWKSYVDSNSGTNRAFTDNLVEKALDEIEQDAGKCPNLVVASYGAHRNLAAQLKAQRRYNGTEELRGGFKGTPIDVRAKSVVVMPERDCPANKAFLLNTDHLVQHQSSDWEFMDMDGAVLNRVPGVDAYEATMYKYHEITTDERWAHGRLDDLTES